VKKTAPSRRKVSASKAKASPGSRNGEPTSQDLLSAREKEFPLPKALKINGTKKTFRRLSSNEVFRACELPEKEVDARRDNELHYEIISQTRAVRAITVGLGVRKPGYNIYVAGVQGTGKTSVIRSFLQKSAKDQKTPGDWVYVYNFKNPESPKTIEAATGKAKLFKKTSWLSS
jgi:Cdc6-like AAA superfamily ATPase